MTNALVAHAALVNIPSTTDPGFDRIEPGEPDNSFLYQKITATQEGLSVTNAQMPRTPGQAMSATPLSDAEQMLIADWITAGALP